MAAQAKPFADHDGQLRSYLAMLDGLCSTYLAVAQAQIPEAFQGRGLVVPEAQVTTALSGEAPMEIHEGFAVHWDHLDRRTALSPQLPLSRLFARLGPSRLGRLALLLALAPEVNRKYERVFAFLQDNVGEKRATVGMAADLLGLVQPLAEGELAALCDETAPLHRYVLTHSRTSGRSAALGLSRPLILRQTALLALSGRRTLPDPLPLACLRVDGSEGVEPLFHEDLCRQAARFAAWQLASPGGGGLLQLYGGADTGRRFVLHYAAHHCGRDVLELDCEILTGLSAELRTAVVETAASWCWLNEAIPALCRFDFPRMGEGERSRLALWLLDSQQGASPLLALCAETPLNLRCPERLTPLQLTVPRPTIGQQHRFWLHALSQAQLPPAEALDTLQLASVYSLAPGQIRRVVSIAQSRCIARGESVIGREAVADGVRLLCSPRLAELTEPLRPVFDWDDLMLEEEQLQLLRQLCHRIRLRWQVNESWGFERKLPYGKGISVLLYGPPGTGKTMTAQVLAREFGLDAYRVDLSRIMDKYIGETEKKLAELFDAAKDSNAILFFDEADALFTKRTEVSDSKDKYANAETAYLLQRIEAHNGVSILATNAAQNFDEAFKRRISFLVNLPMPAPQTRRRLWQSVFPAQAPLRGVNLDFFADRFELTGSSIKNIAVASAFLAAAEGSDITRSHITQALRDEYQKTGRVLMEHELY